MQDTLALLTPFRLDSLASEICHLERRSMELREQSKSLQTRSVAIRSRTVMIIHKCQDLNNRHPELKTTTLAA
jgi:hypothetical protein